MLKEELMAPVSTGGPARISPMTLAAFEDSGWYTPNYTLGRRFAKGAWFARCVLPPLFEDGDEE